MWEVWEVWEVWGELFNKSVPNDARCYNGGNLRNALAPQCPMPHAQCPMPNAQCPTTNQKQYLSN
ncbi:hypothetical protein B4U84_09800 [Westiellopsis prolifica IICB1]|nr:hypothetical protein B4U84_09800 [Westiellopsis prolifica IICB1]